MIDVVAVNDPVTTHVDYWRVLEDTALMFAASDLAFNDWAGPPNEADHTLTVTGVTSNAGTHGTATLTNGLITYTPQPDYFGKASFDYTVCDNGTTNGTPDPQCGTETVTITVEGVNDTPSFAKGPDQTVQRNAGMQLISGWTTEISAGPPNEAVQQLTFVVTTDNDALFTVRPRVDSDGTLRYAPAENASGTANVTVFLRDSGGVANGGSNIARSQTFMLVVTP